jgi:hypothetical protein
LQGKRFKSTVLLAAMSDQTLYRLSEALHFAQASSRVDRDIYTTQKTLLQEKNAKNKKKIRKNARAKNRLDTASA